MHIQYMRENANSPAQPHCAVPHIHTRVALHPAFAGADEGDATEADPDAFGAGSPPVKKLHSTSSSGRPSGFLKKSKNAHPRGAGALPAAAVVSWSSSHFPRRAFTPSTPSFHAGNPNPCAITGGRARGKAPAEKNAMFSVGWVYPPAGGTSVPLASSNFSGMLVKDGMLYLQFLPIRIVLTLWAR